MATYSRLLIDAGNGIIDYNKLTEKDSGASLIIGLGGTGTDAVIKIKREVFRRLRPDNPDAAIPTHKNIKFLVVDSDSSKVNAMIGRVSDIEKSEEYFDISNVRLQEVFCYEKWLQERPEMHWLNYKEMPVSDSSGIVSHNRQIGRFLLVERAAQFYEKIKTDMQGLLSAENEKIHIHICAGVSGSIGSGTFLDVCYLVRRALQELGDSESKISGYFILPDVNLTVSEMTGDILGAEHLKSDGYSALKELDYCMSFDKNADSFRMDYGFLKINDNRQPVDLCYLISARDSNGILMHNGYDYAMGVTAEYVISCLTQVKKIEGIDFKGYIEPKVHLANHIKSRHGANVNYNIIGVSTAEIPLDEITTYLSSKLFEKYDLLFDKTPTEKELDEFILHTQLGYDSIKKEVNKNCQPQLVFLDGFDAKSYKQNGNADFVKCAEDFLANNKGHIRESVKNLLMELENYDIPENSTSLISRTYKEIYELYATKMEYGPVFAYKLLLGGNNKNLIHRIDGYIKRNKEFLDAELRQSELRDDEYKSAKMRVDSANRLNGGRRIREYKQALNNLYVHQYHIEMYRQIGTVLQKYKEQVMRLVNEYFIVLVEVFETLKNTFDENIHILTDASQIKSLYKWKIVDIKEIQETLDNSVENHDASQSFYCLINKFLQNVKLWINNDENNITKMISDFMLCEFKEETQKTIIDYLCQKFCEADRVMLAEKIEQEIFVQKLQSFSLPIFEMNDTYRNNIVKKKLVFVPYNSMLIAEAVESYRKKAKDSFEVICGAIENKISVLQIYSGIPLCAYQPLTEYEMIYQQDMHMGKHLYETEVEDWRIKLPSPIPDSFNTGFRNELVQNRNDKIKAVFEQAREKGIVYEDQPNRWVIACAELFNPDTFIDEMGGYKVGENIDDEKAKHMLEALKAKKQELRLSAEIVAIPSAKAVNGFEHQVMMDLYFKAPVLNKIVEEQLKQVEAIDKKLKKLLQV